MAAGARKLRVRADQLGMQAGGLQGRRGWRRQEGEQPQVAVAEAAIVAGV